MLKLSRRTISACSIALVLAAAASGHARASSPTSGEDAWTVITSEPQFSDAVALLEYAGLAQYVKNDRFTAFVPTNSAFEKNPEVLPELMKGRGRAFPDTTLAVIFIRSHAIFDLHPLSQFSGRSQKLTAISGNTISIDGSQPGVYAVTWVSVQSKTATAHLAEAPITTANALIYPIDTVVLTNPTD
jgi:uncharacterized surface protein with fasciclin (FAS1) repeats